MLDKPLTPEQKAAAQIEALGGFSAKDVADKIGVKEHQVRYWRKNPLYSSTIDSLARQSEQDLQPQINNLKSTVFKLIKQGYETLGEALEATDEEGLPDHPTRIKAASKLIDQGPKLFPKEKDEDEGQQASAQAILQVNIDPSKIPNTITQPEPPALENPDEDPPELESTPEPEEDLEPAS